MKLEVYLSQGKETEMLKAGLYINGVKPLGAIEPELQQREIAGLIGRFYDALEKGGFAETKVELKNNGLKKEVYEEVKNQISGLLRVRNAKLN